MLQVAARKMHQTTVRFGPDLWQALEEECARLNVSVAQYLREAALTRLVYAAGKRGDDEFEAALGLVAGEAPHAPGVRQEWESYAGAFGELARERAKLNTAEATAVAAQGRLARQRAKELRERARARPRPDLPALRRVKPPTAH